MPESPTTLGHGRTGTCCACSRCGTRADVFMYLSSILSYISYAPYLGRRFDMTAILLYRPLNPNGRCQLLPGACLLSRPKPAQEQCQKGYLTGST